MLRDRVDKKRVDDVGIGNRSHVADAGNGRNGGSSDCFGETSDDATARDRGVLGVDERPRFRSYVVEQRRPSYQYREDVRIGAVLPEEGVTYYDVPPEYGAREYRYTVVNGRTVLVEPRTRRIVEVVE